MKKTIGIVAVTLTSIIALFFLSVLVTAWI